VVCVTLTRISYPGRGVTKVRLEECPCGHEFDDDESRCAHIAAHSPEDFGLDSTRGGYAADGGDR